MELSRKNFYEVPGQKMPKSQDALSNFIRLALIVILNKAADLWNLISTKRGTGGSLKRLPNMGTG